MVVENGEMEVHLLGEISVPVPLWPPQIPYGLAWVWTRAPVVGD